MTYTTPYWIDARKISLKEAIKRLYQLHRENDLFTAEQCEQVNDLLDTIRKHQMASKTIGKVSKAALAKGKIQPVAKATPAVAKGKAAKKTRLAKALTSKRTRQAA